MASKKTKTNESNTRKYFGIYNDTNLKNSYAQRYVMSKHNAYAEMSRRGTEKVIQNAMNKAESEYKKVFGDDANKLKDMEQSLHNAAEGWIVNSNKAQEAYKYVDNKEIKKMAEVMFREGGASETELQQSKLYFQNLMRNLLQCFSVGDGLDMFKDCKEISNEGLSAEQLQKLLDGSSELRKRLIADAPGAANSIQSLFASLENILKNIEEGQNKWKWMSSKGGKLVPSVDMQKKSIGKSITFSIHSIQGAIVERNMSASIANTLMQVDSELADFGKVLGTSVQGSKTNISTGKFGKSDIAIEGKNHIVGVSAKSASLNKSNKEIKFHTGGAGSGARDEFFDVVSKNFREAFFTFNHLRQISVQGGNTGWVKSMKEMATLIASLNIEKAIGTQINGTPPVYFLAFKDTMIPAYKLYEKLANGEINAYISGKGKSYYDYDWSQPKDYESLKDGNYFKSKFDYGTSGYSPYVTYVNSRILSNVSLAVQIQLKRRANK